MGDFLMIGYLNKLHNWIVKPLAISFCALNFSLSPAYSNMKSLFDPDLDPETAKELGLTLSNTDNFPKLEKIELKGLYSDFTQESEILTFWGDKEGISAEVRRKVYQGFTHDIKVDGTINASSIKTEVGDSTYKVNEIGANLNALIRTETEGETFQRVPFIDHELKLTAKIVDTEIKNEKLGLTQDAVNVIFIPGYKINAFISPEEIHRFLSKKIPEGEEPYDYLKAKGENKRSRFPRVGLGLEKVINASGDKLSEDSTYINDTFAHSVNEPWIITGDFEIAKKLLFTGKYFAGKHKDNFTAVLDYYRNNLLVPKVEGNRRYNTAERARLFYDADFGRRNIVGIGHSVKFFEEDISIFADYSEPGIRYWLQLDTQVDTSKSYGILAKIPFSDDIVNTLSFWKSEEEKNKEYNHDVIELIAGFKSKTFDSDDRISYFVFGVGWDIKRTENVKNYLELE
jgi:hypothetical protein